VTPAPPTARRVAGGAPWPVLLIVVAACLVRVPLLFGGQVDYDEGVYWASLRSMSAGHPLFSSVYSSQPPGFLLGVAPFFAVGHSLAWARAGVLVFFAVGLVATYVAVRALLGERAAVVAVVLLAVDPLMLRQSVTLQADGPATALGMVALACAALSLRGRAAVGWCCAAGVALGFAVLVKLLAVVFVVPVMVVVIVLRSWRSVVALALGAVLGALLVLAPFADRLRLVWSQSVGGHLSARTLNEGGLTHDMALALARESPFWLAALLGVAVLVRRMPRLAVVLGAWAAAVAGLSLLQHPLWPHHLVIAAPLAAVAAAGLATLAVRGVVVAAGVVALAAAGMVTGVRALDRPFTADTHPAAVAVLQRLTRPADLVISDDQFAVAAAGRDTPPELVDTSYVRIDSEPVTDAAVESIAVRDHVRAFYVGTGRLPHIGALMQWVVVHYPRAVPVGDGTVVYTTP
jgi:4-amino-4-deoxy-L-arabinose transferase-like glycosyltransferase